MELDKIVVTAIITFVIGGLLGGMVVAYLTTPKPILFSEDKCDKYIDLNWNPLEFNFNLRNRAENTALATVCLQSSELYFKASNGDLVHNYCFTETGIHPKSSELQINYKAPIGKIEDGIKDNSNATINVGISCSQKIWSLLRRDCGIETYSCVYKKEGSSLRLKNN